MDSKFNLKNDKENLSRFPFVIFADFLNEKDCEAVSLHLLDALKVHPKTRDKTSALIFDYEAYDINEDSGTLPVA